MWLSLNYIISLGLSTHIYKPKTLDKEIPTYKKSLPYGLNLWFGIVLEENMVQGDTELVLAVLKVLFLMV